MRRIAVSNGSADRVRHRWRAGEPWRELPPAGIEAGLGEVDPDRWVLKMLGARARKEAQAEAGRDEIL